MDRIKNNQYTFEVLMSANKFEIKKAVHDEFKVDVLKVRTVIRKGKIQNTGKKRIQKQMAKKKFAIVSIKEGQKIEAFETGK